MTARTFRLGIAGARGHVGAELIRLVAGHPVFDLAFVSSRELEGQRVADHVDAWHGELRYTAADHAALPGFDADGIVLALPNGKAGACVAAFDAAGVDPVIIDLSADHRFDPGWYYGLPELTRADYRGQRRISNPGCYATAMQLAIAPMRDVLQGPVQCFGVSGHSGAGTSASEKNDPQLLRGLQWQEGAMRAALDASMYATDLAVDLARDGMPFREAYRQAADPVRWRGGSPAASLAARVSPGASGDLRLGALRTRLESL